MRDGVIERCGPPLGQQHGGHHEYATPSGTAEWPLRLFRGELRPAIPRQAEREVTRNNPFWDLGSRTMKTAQALGLDPAVAAAAAGLRAASLVGRPSPPKKRPVIAAPRRRTLAQAHAGSLNLRVHIVDQPLPRLAGCAATQLERGQFLATVGEDCATAVSTGTRVTLRALRTRKDTASARAPAPVAPGPEGDRQLLVHHRLAREPDLRMNQLAQRDRPLLGQRLRLPDTLRHGAFLRRPSCWTARWWLDIPPEECANAITVTSVSSPERADASALI